MRNSNTFNIELLIIDITTSEVYGSDDYSKIVVSIDCTKPTSTTTESPSRLVYVYWQNSSVSEITTS